MKFDIVIGNPPYNKGGVKQNRTIYHKFIEQAITLSKEVVTLIVPGGYVYSIGSKFNKTVTAMNDFGVNKIVFQPKGVRWFPKPINILHPNYFILEKGATGKVQDFKVISPEDQKTIELAKKATQYLDPYRGGQAYEHSPNTSDSYSEDFPNRHIPRVTKEGPKLIYSNVKPVTAPYLVVMSERFTGPNPSNINIVKGPHSLSCNVIAFKANTKQEAEDLKEYLLSEEVKPYIIAFKGLETGPFKLGAIRQVPTKNALKFLKP